MLKKEIIEETWSLLKVIWEEMIISLLFENQITGDSLFTKMLTLQTWVWSPDIIQNLGCDGGFNSHTESLKQEKLGGWALVHQSRLIGNLQASE